MFLELSEVELVWAAAPLWSPRFPRSAPRFPERPSPRRPAGLPNPELGTRCPGRGVPHGLALRTAAAGGPRPSVPPAAEGYNGGQHVLVQGLALPWPRLREGALGPFRAPASSGKAGMERPPRGLSQGKPEFVREMCRTRWQIHRTDPTQGHRGHDGKGGAWAPPASGRETALPGSPVCEPAAQKGGARALAGCSGDLEVASRPLSLCPGLASHLSIDSMVGTLLQ